ncbi:MAG: chemotaxis protein CheW [Nitrospirae bacterium]|nr:chemotaxis protein CheW [Nitrospirota bacterium]
MNNEETWNKLIQEFLLESAESIGLIERGLLALEANPGNKGLIDDIFRHMHTVKGNCLMLGFTRLEELAHSAESVLFLLREGAIPMDRNAGTTLLSVVDCVARALKTIEKCSGEGDADFSALIGKLRCIHPPLNSLNTLREATASGSPDGYDFDFSIKPPELSGGSDIPTFNSGESSLSLDSVHLPVSRLTALVNLAGTVLVTYNQLRYSLTQNRPDYPQLLDSMEQQIQHLQDEVLTYTLQPIGHIWNTYHRLVRELAVDSGKKVYLQMKGEDTEVDRTVLISLKNILGHLIRNAIDHGIEPSDVRLAGGKSAVGKVELSAEQRHGQIYMKISDDGSGVDIGRVREKAVALGLLTAAQAGTMDDASAINLIMEPGFSTTESVSKISGRGIGMDVVKKTVEKAGGTLSVSSAAGKGTCFTIRIPQSMAIVPVLIVRSMQERFAIPQANVVELLSLYGGDVRENVQMKMHTPMVRCRGGLLPLLRLRQALNQCQDEEPRDLPQDQCHVVLLRSDEGDFGLEVDGAEEIANLVVKPLIRIFSHITILSGSAVMPDGTVSFLLNITELRKALHPQA